MYIHRLYLASSEAHPLPPSLTVFPHYHRIRYPIPIAVNHKALEREAEASNLGRGRGG